VRKLFFALFLVLLLIPSLSQAKIYQWVDDLGIIHHSTLPKPSYQKCVDNRGIIYYSTWPTPSISEINRKSRQRKCRAEPLPIAQKPNRKMAIESQGRDGPALNELELLAGWIFEFH